ncbi:MAG: rod shape-determining protein MreC [Bryobacterales bacterium]|nr:rod shape-determining protein MreC [Bryobacterales bacterium]
MDSLLNRYRNISFLLLMILAQLLLLAYQVRSNQDVRLIRVWAVTAVTPMAKAIEATRSSVASFYRNYISLRDIRAEHLQLRDEVGRLKMENQFLRSELATADRAGALTAFQKRSQSRTVAARVLAAGAGTSSRIVHVDRGAGDGVQKGMAVVTPDGIVGKVIAVFPTASQVILITDPSFAAGVISQRHRVRGTLKGQGFGTCKIDFVQSEEKVDVGEWFYTSGDDLVFPKGMPVGQVRIVNEKSPFLEIVIEPSGFQHGLEEVLIVLEGVHGPLPEQPVQTGIYLGTAPPEDPGAIGEAASRGLRTDADRLRERYRAIGDAQGHAFGEGGPGARPPDFNLPGTSPRPATPPAEAPPAEAISLP